MIEKWAKIQDANGYEVSNFGRVRRVDPNGARKVRVLKPIIHHSGYIVYTLTINGKRVQKTAHPLVAKAFILNPHNKPFVNHIDGNKENNHVDNLEWVTASENTRHAFKHGLMHSPNKGVMGVSHYASKKLLQYDLNGTYIKTWDCYSDASRFYGISTSTICNCIAGRIKSAHGYIWKPYSDDYELEISVPHNRKSPKTILQYTTGGSLVKSWDGYGEIEKSGIYNRRTVSACCNGKNKTAYGFKWVVEYR